jgi:hypothetical protein
LACGRVAFENRTAGGCKVTAGFALGGKAYFSVGEGSSSLGFAHKLRQTADLIAVKSLSM